MSQYSTAGRRDAAPPSLPATGAAANGAASGAGAGTHRYRSDTTRPASRSSYGTPAGSLSSSHSSAAAAAMDTGLAKMRLGRAPSTPSDGTLGAGAGGASRGGSARSSLDGGASAAAAPSVGGSGAAGGILNGRSGLLGGGAPAAAAPTVPPFAPAAAAAAAKALLSSAAPGAAQARLPAGGDLWVARDQDGRIGGGAICRAIGGVPVVLPAWNQSRPWLTGLHLLQPQLLDEECGGGHGSSSGAADLAALPAEAAEQLLVDDVLSALMGLEGTYVRCQLVPAAGGAARSGGSGAGANGGGPASWSGPRLAWRVAAPLEPCLREQVEHLLPLAEAVSCIARFVETRSGPAHGKVGWLGFFGGGLGPRGVGVTLGRITLGRRTAMCVR